MHHIAQLVDGGVAAHQAADFLYDVGRMSPIGMTAHDAVGGIGEELEHALGLVHGQCLAVGAPEGLATPVVGTAVLELVVGGSYAGCLRVGEDGRGHDVEADAVGASQEVVDGSDGLHLGRMSQELATVDIAYGIDVRKEEG